MEEEQNKTHKHKPPQKTNTKLNMPKSHFSKQLHHRNMWTEKKILRKTFESQKTPTANFWQLKICDDMLISNAKSRWMKLGHNITALTSWHGQIATHKTCPLLFSTSTSFSSLPCKAPSNTSASSWWHLCGKRHCF